jgi:diketogulonate reductase-like aldo/keto reductase
LQYLTENLKALDVKLSADEVKQVRELVEKADAAQGDRYPPGVMEMLYADTPVWSGK